MSDWIDMARKMAEERQIVEGMTTLYGILAEYRPDIMEELEADNSPALLDHLEIINKHLGTALTDGTSCVHAIMQVCTGIQERRELQGDCARMIDLITT